MLCRVGLVVVKYRTRNSLRFVSEEEEEKEERNDWKVSFASKNLLTRYYGVSEI